MRAHLEALSEFSLAKTGEESGSAVATRDTYIALARATVSRALNNGTISDAQATEMLDLLHVSSDEAK